MTRAGAGVGGGARGEGKPTHVANEAALKGFESQGNIPHSILFPALIIHASSSSAERPANLLPPSRKATEQQDPPLLTRHTPPLFSCYPYAPTSPTRAFPGARNLGFPGKRGGGEREEKTVPCIFDVGAAGS